MLRRFMGTARYVYNSTVDYLKQPNTKADWMGIKKQIIDSLPEWAKETPYQVKSIAVKEACEAVRNAKKKFMQTKVFNEVHFRSKKGTRQSIHVRKESIGAKGIFTSVLGEMRYSEDLPEIRHDCRLVCEYGRWYVVIPFEMERQGARAKRGVVSIDPGVRTFLTCYCEDGVAELGANAWEGILKLCHSLDTLQHRMSKARAKQRQNMRRASRRLQFRLKCKKDELQWKCATFLAKNFDTIVIPPFCATEMSVRSRRRIRSKTVRSMLNLGHSEFRAKLQMQCEKYGGRVVLTQEDYTSRTCPSCGQLHEKLGGSKVFRCPRCGCVIPRDANGARNILLRAMVDSPTQFTLRETAGGC